MEPHTEYRIAFQFNLQFTCISVEYKKLQASAELYYNKKAILEPAIIEEAKQDNAASDSKD